MCDCVICSMRYLYKCVKHVVFIQISETRLRTDYSIFVNDSLCQCQNNRILMARNQLCLVVVVTVVVVVVIEVLIWRMFF